MDRQFDISFESFYSVIADYLLRNHLVDKIDFNEKRLVVHEKESDFWFEFVLEISHLEAKKNG